MPERTTELVDYPARTYAAVLVGYVLLGLLVKSLVLNWVVGPIFLLIVLYVPQKVVQRVRRRGKSQ